MIMKPRYLDDLLDIDTPYFKEKVHQIRPLELKLNKANTSDTDPPLFGFKYTFWIYIFLFLTVLFPLKFMINEMNLSLILLFPFSDGDVQRRPSYGMYISQFIRFATVCSHVDDFNARNECLTAKLLKQGYRYHKLRKAFSMFCRRHHELVSKFSIGLKYILHQGLKAYRNQTFICHVTVCILSD